MPVTLGHRTLQMHVFCFLLIAISFGSGATERLGSDGLCSLYAFLPYTADGYVLHNVDGNHRPFTFFDTRCWDFVAMNLIFL